MRVHLRRAAENDAVLIDDIDLTVGLERAEDLRRRARRVVDFVEGDPLPRVRAAAALVEAQRRVLADVEGLPGEQRLLRGLLDVDRGASARSGLRRRLHALPGGRGIRDAGTREPGARHEAAGHEAVRHVGQSGAGMIRVGAEIRRAAAGCRAGRGLHRLYVLHRLRGAGKHVAGVVARLRGGRGIRAESGGRTVRAGRAAAAQNVARPRAHPRCEREANPQRRREAERTRPRVSVRHSHRRFPGVAGRSQHALRAAFFCRRLSPPPLPAAGPRL